MSLGRLRTKTSDFCKRENNIVCFQFMFIEGADVPIQGKPYKLKETLRSVTPAGNVLTTSKTVYRASDGMANISLFKDKIKETVRAGAHLGLLVAKDRFQRSKHEARLTAAALRCCATLFSLCKSAAL